MKFKTFYFFISLLCSTVQANPNVIDGPIINSANGHSYYLLSTSTWTQAEAKAIELGGHLAIINNAAENTWVSNTFLDDAYSLWIGLSDQQQEGTFVHVNGEPATYTNWSSGEPNNAGGQEDFIQIWTGGRWNDVNDVGGLDAGYVYGVVELSQIPSNSTSTIGVFHPITSTNYTFLLRKTNTAGPTDTTINYGLSGDKPIVGDWDGDGISTIGVFRSGTFYLHKSNTDVAEDIIFAFGQTGDLPVAGDWNGDGVDTVGVYRNGAFLLRDANSAGDPTYTFALGIIGDQPLAGDWTNKGFDSTGVFRPSDGALYLKNSNTTGFADMALNYGIPGDKPITGDWDGDGTDTIGVYRDGVFMLRNSNTLGYADIYFSFGTTGDEPISGVWGANAPTCNYSISPSSADFPATGGTSSVNVSAETGCNWTATTNNTNWITITQGSSGSGNGTVALSASNNTNTNSRAATLTIAGKTFTVQQDDASGGESNLTPYKPADWSDKIVVSNTTGTTTDSNTLKSNETLYVDWAVVNNGNADANGYSVTLYVDGVNKGYWNPCNTIAPIDGYEYYCYVVDADIGLLSVGTHVVKIVADSTNIISESNESDNTYEKTITVTSVETCNYSISPSSQSFTSNGGTGSINVSTGSDCNWSASSNANWISITSGNDGTGNGTVNYSVINNSSTNTRSGTVTVAGKTFTVEQSGASGGESNLTPYKPDGWSDKIVVSNTTGTTTDSNTLKSNETLYVDWAVINNGNADANGYSVNLYIDGIDKGYWNNNTPTNYYSYVMDVDIGLLSAGTHIVKIVADSTNIISESNESDNVYERNITVLNDTPTCNYSISPASQSFAATGGTNSVSVYADNDCDWTAYSNADWIVITSGSNGNGNDTVYYSVANNASTNTRSGTVTVAGKTFTVEQSGASGGGGNTICIKNNTSVYFDSTPNGWYDLITINNINQEIRIDVGSTWCKYSLSDGYYLVKVYHFYSAETYVYGKAEFTLNGGQTMNLDLP